jgi:hypothetical protein
VPIADLNGGAAKIVYSITSSARRKWHGKTARLGGLEVHGLRKATAARRRSAAASDFGSPQLKYPRFGPQGRPVSVGHHLIVFDRHCRGSSGFGR